MGIDVLGPLRVDGNGVSLQRRDQVVLSALALRPGDVMTTDGLAEALWGEMPPVSWPKLVQGSVLRIRKAFGTSLIETTSSGYRLTMARDQLDSARFEELIERGQALAVDGEFDRAAVVFGRALELWRGRPFEVLDSWSAARIEAARLDELCRSAQERLLDARLASGEHRDVVSAAEARVAEEPLREHRWATLALALYRCGRQADALRSLKLARHALREQLGIEPGAELVALEQAILRQDDALLAVPSAPSISGHCPYKGLAPYDVDDTEAFFGRDDEVAKCVERLRAHPLLVITGPSGCGKSSLVRAGLTPALTRAGQATVVFVPGADPEAAMSHALASSTGSPVLVVDQFEELFTVGAGASASEFCGRLADYTAVRAPVVVAVRADHVAALAASQAFARLAEQGMHLVTPLAGDSLRRAIEGPAERAGLRLEAGLVDFLMRDCEGEPGALPLLSHALTETWRRRDGRVLTVEGYRASGEIRGAVARSADRLYESLPAEQRPKLRSMLLRLVSPSADGEPVRSRVATRSLGGDADRERMLGLLVRARLVTAEQDSVELAHEALARAWPRLRAWLDEDASGQRILRHLSAAADGWESLGRSATELYRGARLEAALEWCAATSPDLTDQEVAFLDASVSDAASERARLADRARLQARQNRRLRRSLAAVAMLLVAAILGGVLAYQQRQNARREGRDAALTALTSSSAALRTNRRDLAALLAVEAYRLAPSAATESALFGTFTASPGAVRSVHTDLVINQMGTGAVFVPGTDTVAVIDNVGAVHLVDLLTGERRQFDAFVNEDEITDAWPNLAADKEGRYLAALWRPGLPAPGSEFSLLTVWDVDTGERRFDAVRIPYRVGSMALSDDGAIVVVSGGYWGRVQIRDGATGELLRELERLPRPDGDLLGSATAAVAFTPDGDVAVGSQEGPIRIVDPQTGAELRRIDGPQVTSNFSIFFTQDGSELVTLGELGMMRFDIASGERLWPEPRPVPFCPTWAYAERIGALLCGDRAGQVTAYDIATGAELGQRFDSQLGGVCSLAVSGDGTRFAEVSSCYGNATIVEWRLDGGGAVSRLVVDTPAEHHVRPFGFAGDADALVTEFVGEGDDAPVTHVIDASTGQLLSRLPGTLQLLPTDDPRRAVAYFPEDGTVGWYDVEQRTRLGPGVELDHGFDYMTAGEDRVVVAAIVTGDDGMVLQGVDPDAGEVGSPTIDGTGEFFIFHVAFGPNEIYTALSALRSDPVYQVQRRDPDSGAVLASASGFSNVAAGGGIVVASTSDGGIAQLDPTSLEPIGVPFPGINGPARTLALDDVGQRLMVLGNDETLRFYDIATRTQLGDPIDLAYDDELHNVAVNVDDPVAGAVLRGDGMQAAADTGQGIVVWDLDPAHWVDAACQLASRNLTHAEWDQYIGDLAPYRRTCDAFPEA